MFTIIHCYNCGIGGSLPVQLTATLPNTIKTCTQCNHQTEQKHTYYFCGTRCLAEWLNVELFTLPCPRCAQQVDAHCLICDGSRQFIVQQPATEGQSGL